ncbi:MAG TPA: phosphate ABC transporter substrate-binding/OmpA family protein [bacterium]|nr:phosphate ABC transporter substrate-binding/OmpA family protein [bacterium]HPR88806.1 phosphate ABC transporter substrate-binding/OmpA family protein [bacterium]
MADQPFGATPSKGGLTFFAKFLIGLLIIAAVGFAAWKFLPEGSSKQELRVHLVTYSGMTPGPYFNNGMSPNPDSRYKKEYGLNVKFTVIDILSDAIQAWKTDQVDVVVLTVDSYPIGLQELLTYKPRIFYLTDKSQGADVIIASPAVKSVADLAGRKVGYVPGSPSQWLLINMLKAANMTLKDVKAIEFVEVPQVFKAFEVGQLDAAVGWSPDDIAARERVPGAHVLKSTKEASEMLFGIMFAKQELIEKRHTDLQHFVEGWMKGAAELNVDQSARRRAASIMTAGYSGTTEEYWLDTFGNLRFATYGDNVAFFGLNPSFKGVTAEMVYDEARQAYSELGLASPNLPGWRNVSDVSLVQAIQLTGAANAAQAPASFTPPTSEMYTRTAVATKNVRVNFGFNSAVLEPLEALKLKNEYGQIVAMNASSRFRIVGHTDNVGGREYNIDLSRRRAKAIVEFFVDTYGLSRNQFIFDGKGPDQPIATNSTEEGKALNRRAECSLL